MTEKQMISNRAGTCTLCSIDFPKGESIFYNYSTYKARHSICPKTQVSTKGESLAGESALRQYESKTSAFEGFIAKESNNPDVIAAIRDSYASDDTKNWKKGAEGEQKVGALLDGLSSKGIKIIHDRRIPGLSANIDHIAITPTGVYIVDSKKYSGTPRNQNNRLFVGKYDNTKLIDGIEKQRAVVKAALKSINKESTVKYGILCFVDTTWDSILDGFWIDKTYIAWPKMVAKTVGHKPSFLDKIKLSEDEIELIYKTLMNELPKA